MIQIRTKPPSSFSYVERRSDILQQGLAVGLPAGLNQSELAERYEVSQQQISKDFDRLDGYFWAGLAHRRDLEIGSVLKRCMPGALVVGDYISVRKAAESHDEYLDGRIEMLEFRRRLDRLEDMADERGGRP